MKKQLKINENVFSKILIDILFPTQKCMTPCYLLRSFLYPNLHLYILVHTNDSKTRIVSEIANVRFNIFEYDLKYFFETGIPLKYKYAYFIFIVNYFTSAFLFQK